MGVHESIRNRRSIRAYRDVQVPQQSLNKVLEAARLAPSANNRQDLKLIVVTEKRTRQLLGEACGGQRFVGEAGVVIVACATEPSRKWHMVDTAIAVDHMTLAAHAEGLGTCWIGAFDEQKLKAILGIPADRKVVVVLPVGVPATEGAPRPRKALEELVCWERWA